MPHAALDIKFHSNKKILKAGNAAAGLYARGLSYSADHLYDGEIPGEWAKANGSAAQITRLLDLGLWQRSGDDFIVPDYLEYNLSREKVKEKSKRGKENADKRWEQRRQDERRNELHVVAS